MSSLLNFMSHSPCPKFKFVPPKLPLSAFRGIILIFSCGDCPTGFYWYFSRGLSLGRRGRWNLKKRVCQFLWYIWLQAWLDMRTYSDISYWLIWRINRLSFFLSFVVNSVVRLPRYEWETFAPRLPSQLELIYYLF